MVLGLFKSHPGRPDMFWLKWSLLADNAAFVPCRAECANGGKFGVRSMTDAPIRHALPQRRPSVDLVTLSEVVGSRVGSERPYAVC